MEARSEEMDAIKNDSTSKKIELDDYKVIIKGAGDLASGVAHRLHIAGFPVVMLELPRPLVVRRSVSFASAAFEGSVEVEGVSAQLIKEDSQIGDCWSKGIIPLLIDPEGKLLKKMKPYVLIDGVMAKRNTGTVLADAPIVIGLGPGFTAGLDVRAVVETKRGHQLGRVFYSGVAAADTGIPGDVAGVTTERLLRAPGSGHFFPYKNIGELVQRGEKVAAVGDIPLFASIDGLVRGMLYPGLEVQKGMKVGDIDPRGGEADWETISDKARAVGGGVLEAIMHFLVAAP